ncbi:hypothetical protein DFH28DRAFT_203073 [Melampsora americana]|nr:hypothetical protein DFH28DRAFT_203073 [Melampsora americana]
MTCNHNNKHHKSTAEWFNKMDLSDSDLKVRWECIKGKYTIAKAYFNETGTGRTAAEEQAGIDTLRKKQELMCPQFKNINNIYGNKANVVPQATSKTMTPKQSRPVSQPSDNIIDKPINPHVDDHQTWNALNKTPEPTPSPSVHNSLKKSQDPLLSPSTSGLVCIIGNVALDGHSPLHSTNSIPSSHHSNFIPPESNETQTRSPTLLPQDKMIPSVKNAVKETKKRKACNNSIANRPMKPLPSIDESRLAARTQMLL